MSDTYGRIKVDEIVNSDGLTVDLIALASSGDKDYGLITSSPTSTEDYGALS